MAEGKKIGVIPAGKADAATTAVAELADVRIKETKRVTTTTPAKKEGGKVVIPASRKDDDLITVELADGSTLTVDANDTEHVNKIEQVAAKVESDIGRGKRKRKTA